ncbi:MAG: SDR family oxidoreductase [Alphaproteobacteria bacterium]|nr:SDR family oxidoreductase [Alphaproteobacteria bacterium]
MFRKLLIFGCGYVGKLFHENTTSLFSTSYATKQYPSDGTFIRFNEKTFLNKDNLKEVTHLLITIPPVEGEDIVLKHHAEDIKNLKSLKWVGYLSTTGVYGDYSGQWVNEETPIHPLSIQSTIRAKIERQWLSLWKDYNTPVHIFRLAGIYGPSRNIIEKLQRQNIQRIYKAGHVFSRIHVKDIVQALQSSINFPSPGDIYNVADDLPASYADLIEEGVKLLKISYPPLIPYEEALISDRMKLFFSESRRVSNKKIKNELGVSLFYPTYKEGLRALFETISKERR